MKKIVLICCGGLLFTAMTCTKDSDTQHHHISFYNASASDIYICRGHNHSDTTLLYVQDVTTPGWFCEVKSHSVNNEELVITDAYEVDLNTHDTLIVFVFNADTLALYGWEYVKEHYLIAQRYDLSLIDLQLLSWRLQFPPSSEMQNIKMWPPYGTYDSLGHPNN